MASEPETTGETSEEPPKKSSMMLTLVLLFGLSVLAVGMGYILGGLVRPGESVASAESPKSADHGQEASKHGEESSGHGEDATASAQTTLLEPIIVTLPKSDNTWLRLELAVVSPGNAGAPDLATQARLLSEFAKYLRSADMKLLYGPSGYLHLQDDLLDLARRQTKGGIDEVLILSLVSE